MTMCAKMATEKTISQWIEEEVGSRNFNRGRLAQIQTEFEILNRDPGSLQNGFLGWLGNQVFNIASIVNSTIQYYFGKLYRGI